MRSFHKPRDVIAGLKWFAITCIALGGAAFPRIEVGAGDESPRTVRFATFNVSLAARSQGELITRLKKPNDKQAKVTAEIIQRVRPDVLLLNEFDYDAKGEALRLLQKNYLARKQSAAASGGTAPEPIRYPYSFTAKVNTGVSSGFDLDHDGRRGDRPGNSAYARDALGYGYYEGQYGMAILSQYPIDLESVRTFSDFLWKDMPEALLPDNPETDSPGDWYSSDELAVLRLSSKSHWDVPIKVSNTTVHVLAAHPTPPVYDGPEDRNGRRNHDEIRLWADYVEPGRADYLYDDNNRRGGLPPDANFVVMGDLNCDPIDGNDERAGIRQLLGSARIAEDPKPKSAGGAEQARLQGGANGAHRGDPGLDTCDVRDDPGPGNLRLDYVLPSKGLRVKDCGVFWPARDDATFGLVGVYPYPGSDHRLVWADLSVPSTSQEAKKSRGG